MRTGRPGWSVGQRPSDDRLPDDGLDTLRGALRQPTPEANRVADPEALSEDLQEEQRLVDVVGYDMLTLSLTVGERPEKRLPRVLPMGAQASSAPIACCRSATARGPSSSQGTSTRPSTAG